MNFIIDVLPAVVNFFCRFLNSKEPKLSNLINFQLQDIALIGLYRVLKIVSIDLHSLRDLAWPPKLIQDFDVVVVDFVPIKKY